MYVILANKDNTLSAPIKDRIVQRSKLVDNLWILSHPIYKGIDMTNATALIEYVLPVSKKYRSETLVLAPEMYEDHLKYTLPIDTELTSEAGDIEIQLTFINLEMGADGKIKQRVRKFAPPHKMTIVPISAWSDLIPDSALNAVDQRIIKVDAQIKAIEEMNYIIQENQVDDLSYDKETRELQLMAGNKEVGNAVKIGTCDDVLKDGIPVVDFNSIETDEPDQDESFNNVVEF